MDDFWGQPPTDVVRIVALVVMVLLAALAVWWTTRRVGRDQRRERGELRLPQSRRRGATRRRESRSRGRSGDDGRRSLTVNTPAHDRIGASMTSPGASSRSLAGSIRR